MVEKRPAPVTRPAAQALPSRQDVVRGIGFVEPTTEIRKLSFSTEGVIESCAVDVGQTVHRGELMMTLRNAPQQAALGMAEREVALASAERDQMNAGVNPFRIIAAERNIELLTAQWQRAQRHYDRVHKLAAGGAAAVDEDDRAKSDMATFAARVRLAEAELDELKHHVREEDRAVAEARVAVAQAQVVSAQRALEETLLEAPFDGTVVEILKREGEHVRAAPGDAALIFADMARLRVRAEIDERYIHLVAADQTTVITARGLGTRRSVGRLAAIKQVMGNKTLFAHDASERKDLDVIQCWIEFPDGFSAPLGLQVDVEIDLAAEQDIQMAIPSRGAD